MKKTILLLLLILVIGFMTRSYFWFNNSSGFDAKESGGMIAHSATTHLNFAADIVTVVRLSCQCTLTPDGSYVGGNSYILTPDGSYVGGNSYILTPDGNYVGGTSYILTPDGSYVGGYSYTLTPDGSYVGGDSYTLTPDGSYEGYYRDTIFLHIQNIDRSEFISRFIYPLYLTPIYIFGLNESTYVFWLHHFFVAFTIIFIFLSASQLGGVNVGLLGAFVYACHLHVAYWFNWLNYLEPFHLHLSMFMYFSLLCWKRASWKGLFFMVLSGALVCITRPDGFAFVVVSFSVLAYSLMAPRFGTTRVIAVFLASTLIFMLSGVYVLTQNKVVREKVFSIIHVGRALGFGSEETPTEAIAHSKLLFEQTDFCRAKAVLDPEKRSLYYWCSVTGLERIKNDPLAYILVLVKRSAHVIFPSFTREGVSWKFKMVARGVMAFIIIGMICGFIFHKKNKLELTGLTLMALAIYAIVTFIESNWVPRVQLSAHLMLIVGASFGWIMLANRLGFVQSETMPVKIQRG